MNPGTIRNNERTRDRDLLWSALMRKPKGVRTCDLDVAPACPICKRFILLWEVKREFESLDWAVRNSEYTINLATAAGLPAYFVCHQVENGETVGVMIVKLVNDFPRLKFNVDEFVAWVERQQMKHLLNVHGKTTLE